MKWMLLIFAAALAFLYYYHTQHPYDASKSTPVVYTKSLQNDEKKAQEAAQKAQAAIDKVNQEAQKATQGADPNQQ